MIWIFTTLLNKLVKLEIRYITLKLNLVCRHQDWLHFKRIFLREKIRWLWLWRELTLITNSELYLLRVLFWVDADDVVLNLVSVHLPRVRWVRFANFGLNLVFNQTSVDARHVLLSRFEPSHFAFIKWDGDILLAWLRLLFKLLATLMTSMHEAWFGLQVSSTFLVKILDFQFFIAVVPKSLLVCLVFLFCEEMFSFVYGWGAATFFCNDFSFLKQVWSEIFAEFSKIRRWRWFSAFDSILEAVHVLFWLRCWQRFFLSRW